jgi:hypothetical protein
MNTLLGYLMAQEISNSWSISHFQLEKWWKITCIIDTSGARKFLEPNLKQNCIHNWMDDPLKITYECTSNRGK